MKTKEVRDAIRPRSISGCTGEVGYEGIAIDSRRITGGELFFALRGERTDGHLFIEDAVERGASGVVCEREPTSSGEAQVFVVDDALTALTDIASWKRNRYGGKVVAVTGSNGKTTTKEFMSSVLAERYNVLKSEENMNTKIGISMTLFKLHHAHDLLVLEMGTNHKSEIASLTELVKPHVGVITNVAPAHLEGLGSVRAIMEEKGKLLQMLPPEGRAVVNGDDSKLLKYTRSLPIPVYTFGVRNGNDFRATGVVLDGFGRPSFMIEKGLIVKLPALGLHNVSNAMAAVAVGHLMGIPGQMIKHGLEGTRIPGMRTELVEHDGIRLLVDCYNANPVSMKMSIRTLCSIEASRRIAVLGPMAELGKRRRALHLRVGGEVARSGIDILIAIGREAAAYIEGAKRWSRRNRRTPPELIFTGDIHAAHVILRAHLREGDLVLLKASRTARLEQLAHMIGEKR